MAWTCDRFSLYKDTRQRPKSSDQNAQQTKGYSGLDYTVSYHEYPLTVSAGKSGLDGHRQSFCFSFTAEGILTDPPLQQ